MKKFFLIQVSIFLGILLLTKVMVLCMPNQMILYKGNVEHFRNMKARETNTDFCPFKCNVEEDIRTGEEIVNRYKHHPYKKEINITFAIVTATGYVQSYSQYMLYDVEVKKGNRR